MSTIGIYFSATDDASPPSGKPEYVQAYQTFVELLAKKGARTVIIRGPQSHVYDGCFRDTWEWKGGKWAQVPEEVPLDVVFIKDRDFPRTARVMQVNTQAFEDLCSLKDETYALFPEVFPKTVVVKEMAELSAALQQVEGDLVVAKPVDGACGRDVFIGPRAEVAAQALPFPLLVQECIDMSQGIPGHSTGAHDLRIVFVGDQVALCTLRTPPEGGLIANAAQGGSINLIPVPDIPPDALALALSIDRRLQDHPGRIYSVDMGLDKGTTWKVIELNAPPGLTPPVWGDVSRYYELLADHLIRMAG